MDEKATIPKFNGKDFAVWKAKIEAIIDDKGLSGGFKSKPIKTSMSDKDAATSSAF